MIDQVEHVGPVPDNHFAQSVILLDTRFLDLEQLLAGTHDDRERGLELIGDVGEEV